MGAGLPSTGTVQDRMGRAGEFQVNHFYPVAFIEGGGKEDKDFMHKGDSKQHTGFRPPAFG
jgi:hypothetical protein